MERFKGKKAEHRAGSEPMTFDHLACALLLCYNHCPYLLVLVLKISLKNMFETPFVDERISQK